MKEIDITGFLTPQLLELLNSNPDIVNMVLGSSKKDEALYFEELNDLKGRIEALEKELADMKSATKKEPKNTFSKGSGKRLG